MKSKDLIEIMIRNEKRKKMIQESKEKNGSDEKIKEMTIGEKKKKFFYFSGRKAKKK